MDGMLGIGGVLVGVAGIVATIVYARRANQLLLARKRLDWADLQAAAGDLSRKIKSDFVPDVLVTPGLTGATFANLLVDNFDDQPPVLVGTRTWKGSSNKGVQVSGSIVLETNKWTVTIPESVRAFKHGNVLIVDDFVMSGDFLALLKGELERLGFESSRIRSAAVAVTRVAISNHKAPDHSWIEVDGDDFYFPWGKAA